MRILFLGELSPRTLRLHDLFQKAGYDCIKNPQTDKLLGDSFEFVIIDAMVV